MIVRERNSAQQIIHRTFQTLYLLTASIQRAESATLKAIDTFDPDADSEETLLRFAIQAAVQGPVEPMPLLVSCEPESTGPLLPVELRAVLNLSPNLRRSFVLRILVGLSRQGCAGLLRLNAAQVDQYTCDALRSLAGLRP